MRCCSNLNISSLARHPEEGKISRMKLSSFYTSRMVASCMTGFRLTQTYAMDKRALKVRALPSLRSWACWRGACSNPSEIRLSVAVAISSAEHRSEREDYLRS